MCFLSDCSLREQLNNKHDIIRHTSVILMVSIFSCKIKHCAFSYKSTEKKRYTQKGLALSQLSDICFSVWMSLHTFGEL